MNRYLYLIITAVTVMLLVVMTIGMFCGMLSQNKEKLQELRELKHENRDFELLIYNYEYVIGKYADSLPDEVLRDFYPQITDLDSLRLRLKEGYERRERINNDGLCY